VVEDSLIGLQAAAGAGMKCIITHTPSTAKQDFTGAAAVYPELGEADSVQVTAQQLRAMLEQPAVVA
jgi:beta-phosphoglucomutase-like phosphatase (HAD superfamily)